MIYKIFEGNMEELEMKLKRVQRKCEKYGVYFYYERVGEEFVEKDENGNKIVIRCLIVDIEGTAIINNWRFIGTVEHTSNGNVIKKCCDVEIPKRYYTIDTICEHCNSNRRRKSTYIVQNTVTNEFK